MVQPFAVFFAAFVVPSCVLAVLAAREWHELRAGTPGPGPVARLRRARGLMVGAGALPLALAALTALLTGGAPLVSPGGWVFLGYGAACGALGPLGAWLYARAAADPRPRARKAAETAPMVLLMLNLVFLVNALAAFP